MANQEDRISTLLGDLAADEPALRREAAERLGDLSDMLQKTGRVTEATNALRGTVSDSVFHVRVAGASALLRLGARDKEAMVVLMDAMAGSDVYLARAALRPLHEIVLARTAGHVDAANVSPVAEALVKGLESDHLEIQDAAAGMLCAMEDLNAGTMTPVLLNIVRNGTPSSRRHAVIVLGHLGEEADKAVPVLVELLENAQEDKRLLGSVARALGEMGPEAKAAIPALMSLLEKEDSCTRAVVVRALGNIGPAAVEAVPALAAAMADEDIRLLAVKALGQIGPSAASAISDLLRAARTDDREVRLAAVVSFGQIGPAAGPSAPFLAEIVTSQDQELRLAAIESLGQIGPGARPAVAALTDALGSKDQETVMAAVHSLGKIGSAASDAVPALVKLLRAEDEWIRWKTINALGEMGEGAEVAVPSLIELLSKKEPEFVGETRESLVKIGAPAVPQLREALQTDNCQLQERAAWTLGMIGPRAAVARNDLLKVFREGGGDAPWAAAAALARIGFKDDVLPGVLAETRHEDPEVRSKAVRALGEMGPAGASGIPRLIEVLRKDEDSWVRVESAWAIGYVGATDSSVVPALVDALLSDGSWDVRGASASALGEIGPPAAKALPALRKVVEEHSQASGHAAKAIHQITTEEGL
jgi:HEAT repeat protein